MSNVVPITPSSVFSAAQLELMKRTVAVDTHSDEFDLFVAVARRTGLDPFRKQISAIVFSKNDAKKRRMSIITTIDGLRVIAARSLRYRPDEDEPAYECDPEEKSETNPLGITKARVRIYIRDEGGQEWRPVSGVAYWSEFAPIKEEWKEDEQTGRRKPTGRMELDKSGNWFRMPRLMIAKCAEAQALRKAFPEDLSGLYEGAELDRAQVLDDTPASELIGHHQTEQRLERLGMTNTILFQFFPNVGLEPIPLGKLADRLIEWAKQCESSRMLAWFKDTNTYALRDFWARSPGDALEVKKTFEKRERELAEAEAAA